jgi:hypothetical protein
MRPYFQVMWYISDSLIAWWGLIPRSCDTFLTLWSPNEVLFPGRVIQSWLSDRLMRSYSQVMWYSPDSIIAWWGLYPGSSQRHRGDTARTDKMIRSAQGEAWFIDYFGVSLPPMTDRLLSIGFPGNGHAGQFTVPTIGPRVICSTYNHLAWTVIRYGPTTGASFTGDSLHSLCRLVCQRGDWHGADQFSML